MDETVLQIDVLYLSCSSLTTCTPGNLLICCACKKLQNLNAKVFTKQVRYEIMGAYHLQGETGSSTACANGKQKSLVASSVQISNLFNQGKPVSKCCYQRLVNSNKNPSK